jgi:hypothetical protein
MPDGPERIVVGDRDQQAVLGVVADHQLTVSEIRPLGRTLEEIYLELTTDDTRGATS